MTIHAPASPEELAAILKTAPGTRLAVRGAGSRPAFHPAADGWIDTAGLGGAIRYDPAELMLTAPAATPMAQIAALLAATGQCLGFEPPGDGAAWSRGAGTLGGAVACGLSGPRRPFAGAARDHVLALAGVTGAGEAFTAGGKVLKNVTGFDLPRLLTGSRGSLAVLTELTVRLAPLPPACASYALPADTAARALRLMADALMVDGGITGAAWADGAVHLRIEAGTAALPALMEALAARLPGGQWRDAAASRAHWAAMADQSDLAADRILWRCPLPAGAAAALELPAGAQLRLDWGGALAWIILPPALADYDVPAAVAAAAGRDGHARRLRLPDGLASAVPAISPADPALAALQGRIKALLDPAGVLAAEAVG
ncbi:MAG: FAD-binding protein [Alphaproteobacteria bacterium]|nr:FAD-binding protein [Alphaproteobacteria bacterium]